MPVPQGSAGLESSDPTPVIDAHAHFFPTGIGSAPDSDPRWPRLEIDPDGSGWIVRGETPFRRVTASTWDVPARLRELSEGGIDRQVISPVPVTLVDWAEPAAARRFHGRQNELIADAVARSAGRLIGFGAVPLQDVAAAVDELERVTIELDLAGIEIGTSPAGRELDDPALSPFFAAAERLDVPLFVHPTQLPGVIRRHGQPDEFGLGMLTDTAMAGSALVFGGVLERHPGLRVLLAHGGGTLAWAFARMRWFAEQSDPGATVRRFDQLLRRLWVDSIVFDPSQLALLVERFGVDRLVLGTDHPFLPGYLPTARETLDRAVQDILHTAPDAAGVDGATLLGFLGIRPAPNRSAATYSEETSWQPLSN